MSIWFVPRDAAARSMGADAVASALEARGELELHGWVYDFVDGDLLVADRDSHFRSLDAPADGARGVARPRCFPDSARTGPA